MDLPKNSEIANPQTSTAFGNEGAEPLMLDDQHLQVPQAKTPHGTSTPETIELDISSVSDRDSSDPVYRLLERSLSHDPYIAFIDRYIADLHLAYIEAMRTARQAGGGEYSLRWEDRAFGYADRTLKMIELVYKIQNRGQQKVVVEHRNDSDRQVRSPRQARQSVPRVHDASVNVPRKA